MEEGRNKRRKKKKKKKIKIPKNKLQFGVHHCPLLDQIRQTFFFFFCLWLGLLKSHGTLEWEIN